MQRDGSNGSSRTNDHSVRLARLISKRKLLLFGLAIFVVALNVRVLFFGLQAIHAPAVWSRSAPFSVDNEMGSIAVNLAQGRGYSSPFSQSSTPTAWLCPFVPLLWALVIKLAGSADGHTALIIAFVNTLPSAACVVVYWLIARHLFSENAALRRTELVVAAVFCAWPDSLYRLDDGWYFAWQELGTALVVFLGMRWIDHPSLKTVTPLGIMGGILALINVAPLPVFMLVLLLPVLQNRQAWKRLLGCGAFGATLTLLIVLPWLIRNAVVFHAFVPLRSTAGSLLYEGNNPNGSVRENAASRQPYIQRAELERYNSLGEVEYSRQCLNDAIAYIRAHPLQATIRAVQRAYVMWLTDALDHWSWDSTKYWTMGRPAIAKAMSSTLAAYGTVILLIWARVSRRLATLPYKWLFGGILFFLPFPYYFTLAADAYSQILRSWMLLLSILAVSADFQPSG
jgi:hypothetical protein